MSKWELFRALGERETVITPVTGTIGGDRVKVRGIVQSVEREDGSGESFNVRMLVGKRFDQPVVVYVRTDRKVSKCDPHCTCNDCLEAHMTMLDG